MGLFGILRKKESTKKWKVFIKVRNELRSYETYAESEYEVFKMYRKTFRKNVEFFKAIEIK